MREGLYQRRLSSMALFLILALAAIRPFVSGMTYPAIATYIRIAIFVIFIAHLFFLKPFFAGNYLGKALLLYFISIIISLFPSINMRSSLQQVYQISALICLFFLVSSLDKNQTKRLIETVLFSACLISIYAIYQYWWGFGYTKEYLARHSSDLLENRYVREILLTRRAIATFFSPNMLGAYLAMAMPLCAGVLLDRMRRKLPYALHVGYLIFIFTALALTKSLAAWLSLGLGGVMFLVLAKPFHRKRNIAICIFILIMPLFIVFLRSSVFLDAANQQNTILQRLGFWKSSVAIIKDFPISGIGIGNLGNIYPKYRNLLSNETMFSHNIFLQIWAENGILGLIAIIFLLLSFIKNSFRIERDPVNTGLLISSYIFIINNMFDFSYFIPQVSFLWWISLGILSQYREKRTGIKSENFIKLLLLIMVSLLIYLNIKSAIALSYFQAGKYKKAISMEPYNDLYYAVSKEYDNAIRLNPYNPFYHKALALMYLDGGMIKEAIYEFEKASSLYPVNEYLHQRLYDLYVKTGDIEKAGEREIKLKEFHSRYSGYYIR